MRKKPVSSSLYSVVRQLPKCMSGTPMFRFISWMKKQRHNASLDQPVNSSGSTSAFSTADDFQQLFPSHLPRRPLGLSSGRPRSRRRAARWLNWRVTADLIEYVWCGLVFLALECPKSKKAYHHHLGDYSTSARHASAFEMLCCDAVVTCRLSPEQCLALGRGTARLHRLQTILSELSPEIVVGSHVNLDSAETVALPVSIPEIEKRVPAECGLCHPENYLRHEHLRAFNDQERLVVEQHPFQSSLPKPCFMVDPAIESKLRELLLERQFACLIPESQIATSHEGRLMLNGMFAVEDRPGKHRLIFDKRPTNSCELSLPWLRLPMGFLFCRVKLRDDEELRCSGSDLDSFFNRLRQNPAILGRAAFGRQVSIEEASRLGYPMEEASRMAVRIIGMGGLNSPAIAQQTHLEVLRANGIDIDCFLEWGAPFPTTPTLSGIFYDDLVVAAVTKASEVHCLSGPDFDIISRALSAYEKAHLPLSQSKSFGFAKQLGQSSADLEFTAWGTQVNSKLGTVGTEARKRSLLCYVGLNVVSGGKVTGSFLRRLVSCFVHPFGHRKELSCVSTVFTSTDLTWVIRSTAVCPRTFVMRFVWPRCCCP